MANARKDPQIGDVYTSGEQMIACVERQDKLVRYVLRMANGAEIAGICDLEKWYEIVCDATPAGRVDVQKITIEE